MKSRQKLPQALAGSVVVQEVDGETLVYDMKRHRVHCLNRAAAALWRACDGRRGVEELARELQDRFPEEVSSAGSKLLAEQILMNLSRARLVTGWTGPAEGSQSRREWLRNTGGFYLAISAVVTIQAPVAAQAGSCLTQSQCQDHTDGSLVGRCCSTGGGGGKKTCVVVGGGNFNCTGSGCSCV